MDGWKMNQIGYGWIEWMLYIWNWWKAKKTRCYHENIPTEREIRVFILYELSPHHTRMCVCIYILFHTTLKTGPQSFTSGKCSAKCECSFKQKRSRMKHIIFIHSLSFFRAFLSTLCSPFLLRLFILFHQNVYEFRSTHS